MGQIKKMNYTRLCSLVSGLEPAIRGVFVYHFSGELLAGGMLEDVKSHLPNEEITKSVRNTISRWKSRESLYPFLGTGKYSITEYEKIKRITILLETHVILVISMEVEVDHDLIIEKVLQLIMQKI
ncbi:MAG: DUF6659 family protein [Nitrosopumilus sp.]